MKIRVQVPMPELGENVAKAIDVEIPMFEMAEFEKVSYEQFKKDMNEFKDMFTEDMMKEMYDNIKLPERSTKDSAGYDFFAPFGFRPTPHGGIKIPTGIRCKIDEGWVLKLYPRSGQGFKFGVQLYNTVGVIDGDYYYSDNEGHIMVKITSKENCDNITQGKAFCQGIFSIYGITKNDNATGIRNGGFGSTDK